MLYGRPMSNNPTTSEEFQRCGRKTCLQAGLPSEPSVRHRHQYSSRGTETGSTGTTQSRASQTRESYGCVSARCEGDLCTCRPPVRFVALHRVGQHTVRPGSGGASNGRNPFVTLADLCELYLAEGSSHKTLATVCADRGRIRNHIPGAGRPLAYRLDFGVAREFGEPLRTGLEQAGKTCRGVRGADGRRDGRPTLSASFRPQP